MSNEQIEQRRENLEALKALGVDPYPYSYAVTHHAEAVLAAADALEASREPVSVAGRLMAGHRHRLPGGFQGVGGG